MVHGLREQSITARGHGGRNSLCLWWLEGEAALSLLVGQEVEDRQEVDSSEAPPPEDSTTS